MVTALEFKEKVNLGVNENGKFYVDNSLEKVESIKNVPIVIENNVLDIDYIRRNLEKFKFSCHAAFIDWENAKREFISKLNDLGVAVFIRVSVVEINNEIRVVVPVDSFESWELVDRVVLLDKTNSMQITQLNEIKKNIAGRVGKPANEIGVCGSPFSFGEDACLCAIWARRLMAKYTSNTEVALPSANHECMETCGCIRKQVITEDRVAPEVKKGGFKKRSEGASGSDEKASTSKTLKGVRGIRGIF